MHPLGNNRQKKKGQHFIPKFYLKQFSTEINGEQYIWCYNKKSGDVFHSNINNVCKENWFYDRYNIYEDALSILDSDHSSIYRFIEKKPMYALKESEKRKIMEFIYVTHARTRRAREVTMDINKEVQFDKDFRRKFQYVFPGHNIEEELELLKQSFQISNIFGTKIPSYSYNPNSEEKMERLMKFDYYILKRNTGKMFYTNDHPISQFDISDKEGVKVAMPLAPDLFLIMSNSKDWLQSHPSQRIQASERFVNEANEATIQVAKDFIFSKVNDFEFVRQFLNN